MAAKNKNLFANDERLYNTVTIVKGADKQVTLDTDHLFQ